MTVRPEIRAEDPLPSQWDALARAPSPWLSTTLLGFSDRSPSDRLRRLLRGKAGRAALDAANGLDVAALEHLDAVAKINAEQAEAAFRRTFVFNVSVPIALAAAATQAAPEAASKILSELGPAEASSYLIAGAVLGIIATVYHAHAKARGARDIADVIALVRAARCRDAA